MALRNNFAVAHNSRLYQIEKGVSSKEMTVEERVNGSMLITHRDVRLPFREIMARPEKQQKPASEKDPKAGEVSWSEAVTHALENVLTADQHVIVIELKK